MIEKNMPSADTAGVKNSAYIHQHALSNVQLELIKLYSTNLNEHEILELKDILVHHFSRDVVLSGYAEAVRY
ncbi:MAG: hypothetical protein ACTFAK_10375 [Candidatus Electronema sp. VV]